MRFPPTRIFYIAFAGYLLFSLAENGCDCDCDFDGGSFERFPPRGAALDHENFDNNLEQKCLDNFKDYTYFNYSSL